MNLANHSVRVLQRAATVALLGFAASVAADPSDSVEGRIYDATEMKTVIGPVNIYAAEGVEALREGDAERAVPLLQQGLKRAQGDRDFVIGLSNLCAAYVLLNEFNTALTYCDRALEMRPKFWRGLNNRALAYLGINDLPRAKADIDRAFELAPQSLNLKKTQAIYDRMANPVEPLIIIDDTEMTRP
ncbi:MAG: tetratricopeptide repeat protein [Pseudomonadota bacterium]